MQIDQKSLARLLSMNDAQLAAVIQKIAAEAGVNPAQLGLNPDNIDNVRRALGSATETDIEQMKAIYDSYRNGKGNA